MLSVHMMISSGIMHINYLKQNLHHCGMALATSPVNWPWSLSSKTWKVNWCWTLHEVTHDFHIPVQSGPVGRCVSPLISSTQGLWPELLHQGFNITHFTVNKNNVSSSAMVMKYNFFYLKREFNPEPPALKTMRIPLHHSDWRTPFGFRPNTISKL